MFLAQSIWSDEGSWWYSPTLWPGCVSHDCSPVSSETQWSQLLISAVDLCTFQPDFYIWAFKNHLKLSEVDWCLRSWSFILPAPVSFCNKSLVKTSVMSKKDLHSSTDSESCSLQRGVTDLYLSLSYIILLLSSQRATSKSLHKLMFECCNRVIVIIPLKYLRRVYHLTLLWCVFPE